VGTLDAAVDFVVIHFFLVMNRFEGEVPGYATWLKASSMHAACPGRLI
jgi:hypothetical protein